MCFVQRDGETVSGLMDAMLSQRLGRTGQLLKLAGIPFKILRAFLTVCGLF